MKELQAFSLKDPRLGQWKDIKNTEILNEEGRLIGMSPRKIQLEIIQQLEGKLNTIINAPGGSGKSKAAQFLHIINILANSSQKLIIAVPKKIIQKGFGAANLHLADGTVVHWDPINLCENSTGKKKELLDFLNRNEFPQGVNERILITTHQALAGLFTELKEEGLDNSLFHNTSIVVDEAHRLLNAEEMETGIEISNGIGGLIKYALKCQVKDPTVGVHLMTATAFRGDTYSLLSKKDFKKFDTYYLPIDKHWEENIKYIEDYSYNYIVYNGAYWKEIEALIKRHKGRNILFFLPRGEVKYEVAAKIKKMLKKHKIKGKVCDLAEDRDSGEREFLKDDINENENDYSSVMSVDIFNEGADWPPCEVVIDLEPASKSLPKAIQRWLRAFRDKDYKKHLHYYSFLPFVLDTLDEDKYLTALNKNFTSFMLAMVIEDVVNPVLIPRPTKIREGNPERVERVDYFAEAVEDMNKRLKIGADVRIDLIALKAQAEDEEKTLSATDIEQTIKKTLKKNNVEKYIEEVALQIYISLKKNIPAMRGVDVSQMIEDGYGEVTKGEIADEIFKDILVFPAMISGAKTFSELRGIYKKQHNTIEENVKLAEKIEKEYGTLPYTKKLIELGYCNIVSCKRSHPEYFAHISQDNTFTSMHNEEERKQFYINLLKSIMKDDKIPSPKELRDMGHSGLAKYIKENKKIFSEYEQNLKKKSLKRHLNDFDALLKENNGILYSNKKLLSKGYGGLVQCRNANKNKFPAVEQDKEEEGYLLKTERINKKYQEQAKTLEAKFGHIPCGAWLKQNGFLMLFKTIRNKPEIFKGMKKEYYSGNIKKIKII